MNKKRKVAIFDIDGTIFRSSLFVEIVEELVRRGAFPSRARKAYEIEYYNWLDRKEEYDVYLDRMVESFHTHIKGIHYRTFAAACENVVDAHKNRVYRYTRDLIQQLKKRDYFLLAISQSPKFALDRFCENLGFNKVYGRMYELGPGNRFTGNITDLHLIANKAAVVRRAAEKEGLTLHDSIGVGDSEGDYAFLDIVDKPIAFNPSKKLYRHAIRNGWKIVVERKNVIYEIN